METKKFYLKADFDQKFVITFFYNVVFLVKFESSIKIIREDTKYRQHWADGGELFGRARGIDQVFS